MALTVEDGTGKSDAESYVSLADFKGYCDGRGMDYSAQADAALEGCLRRATQYLDARYRFKAARLTQAQALSFPRSGLVDWDGFTVEGVPARLKSACCELAFAAISVDLFENLDRGGRVKSESVGPLSVTYADDAPAGKLFGSADALVQPYLRQRDDTGGPFFGGSEVAQFERGMHDNNGA